MSAKPSARLSAAQHCALLALASASGPLRVGTRELPERTAYALARAGYVELCAVLGAPEAHTWKGHSVRVYPFETVAMLAT